MDINPLRNATNIIRHTVALTASYEEGIWIGKRLLGASPFSVSLSIGADVYHWAIMIDGTFFHVIGKKDNQLQIEITQKESTRISFVWYLIKRDCNKYKNDMEKFVTNYRDRS